MQVILLVSHWSESVYSPNLFWCQAVASIHDQVYRDWCTVHLCSHTAAPSKVRATSLDEKGRNASARSILLGSKIVRKEGAHIIFLFWGDFVSAFFGTTKIEGAWVFTTFFYQVTERAVIADALASKIFTVYFLDEWDVVKKVFTGLSKSNKSYSTFLHKNSLVTMCGNPAWECKQRCYGSLV